jgi:UDP-GlcNAc:undecaprenyl-phosphate GlcNAc-1-phosphate transferase
MTQQDQQEAMEEKLPEVPPEVPPEGPRLRVSKKAILLCQILLGGIGIWWAYIPAQEDLAQAQIPGFLIALAISWWLTPEISSRALKLGLVDKPGEARRIHKTPVPRLGGVGIYMSVLITIVSLIAIAGRLPKDARGAEGIVGIAVGGTLVFVLGLIDDLEPIRALYKLVIQVLAGCTAYSLGVRIKTIPLPDLMHIDFGWLHLHNQIELGPFGLPLTVIWLVGVANAVNLIDGMDGLAAGVSAISALTIWSVALSPDIHRPFAALMAAVVAGALLGFLRWNFNPARIFLGDSGAYLTGFILAAISITGVIKGAMTGTIVVPTVILVGFILLFPLADTTWAILRRTAKGKNPMAPDRLHIHHRLLDTGLDQKKVAYIIYGISGVSGLLATCFVHQQEYFLKLVGGVLVLAWFFAEVLNGHRQKGRRKGPPGGPTT